MSWWLEILEGYWNALRDAAKKYGKLPAAILVVYFAGMAILIAFMRCHIHSAIWH